MKIHIGCENKQVAIMSRRTNQKIGMRALDTMFTADVIKPGRRLIFVRGYGKVVIGVQFGFQFKESVLV